MSPQDVLERAEKGDPQAIAMVISEFTQPDGVSVKVARQGDALYVLLESAHAPEPETMVALVCRGLTRLQTQSTKTVRIYWRRVGEKVAAWNREVKLEEIAEVAATLEPEVPLSETESSLETGLTPVFISVKPSEIVTDTPVTIPASQAVRSDEEEPIAAATDMLEPEMTEPEMTEPEITEPEITEPEITEPEMTEPETDPQLDGGVEESLSLSVSLPEATVEPDEIDLSSPDIQADLERLAEGVDADAVLAETQEFVASSALEDELNLEDQAVAAEFEAQIDLEDELSLESELESGLDLESDLEDEFSLESEESELEDGLQLESELQNELSLEAGESERESGLELETGLEDEFSLESEGSELESGLDLESELEEVEAEAELGDRLKLESELEVTDAEAIEAEAELGDRLKLEAEPEPEEGEAEIGLEGNTGDWLSPEPEFLANAEPQELSSASHVQIEVVTEVLPEESALTIVASDSEYPTVRQVLRKPESILMLAIAIFLIFWQVYLEIVLNSGIADEGAISGRALARRLKVNSSTVSRRKNYPDFHEWTRSLDPDGLAWVCRSDGKFIPMR